jgi:hypothetical protein
MTTVRSSSPLTDGSGFAATARLPRMASPASFPSSSPTTSAASEMGGNPRVARVRVGTPGCAYVGLVGGANGEMRLETRGRHPAVADMATRPAFPRRRRVCESQEEER